MFPRPPLAEGVIASMPWFQGVWAIEVEQRNKACFQIMKTGESRGFKVLGQGTKQEAVPRCGYLRRGVSQRAPYPKKPGRTAPGFGQSGHEDLQVDLCNLKVCRAAGWAICCRGS